MEPSAIGAMPAALKASQLALSSSQVVGKATPADSKDYGVVEQASVVVAEGHEVLGTVIGAAESMSPCGNWLSRSLAAHISSMGASMPFWTWNAVRAPAQLEWTSGGLPPASWMRMPVLKSSWPTSTKLTVIAGVASNCVEQLLQRGLAGHC